MQNKGIVIWLTLLTVYIVWHEFQHYKNLEVRKNVYANTKESFETLETYLNGPINERISKIEKFLKDNWGEK